MPRRRLDVLLLPVLALTVLTACSAGPSSRPVIAVRGDVEETPSATVPTGKQPVPGLEEFRGTGLNWSDCTDTTERRMGDQAPAGDVAYQCARLPTLLDAPSRPGRGNLSVALLRAGTGKSALVVVGDPDGETGTLRAARLAATLPPQVLSTFTLIGLDRRGTGRSDGLQCVPGSSRVGIVEFDPAKTDQAELLSSVTGASQECVLDLENRLTALDSWRTSADLERLREALGVNRLNAIGIGDGSRVLSLYASRYPNRIGRMVFDGAPDPTADVIGMAEARAAAAEQTFDEFAKDCATRACPLGANAEKEFTALLDQVRQKPVRGQVIDLTPGTALYAVLLGLADRPRWPALADAIAQAKAGNAEPLTAFAMPLVSEVNENPPRLDAGLVTHCNDYTMRVPPERVAGVTKDWREKHPLFGALFGHQLLLCGSFPVPPAPKVPPLVGAPSILVLSTANDPVTPQSGSERAAQQLPAGVLVGWQGAGHGALVNSQCATEAAQQFLVDAKVPTSGTVCPP